MSATCQDAYDAIEAAAPTTAKQVVAILLEHDPMGRSAADAFWSSDESLVDLLAESGWLVAWFEAYYYWQVKHPETGSILTFIEGDVYADQPLKPMT